MPPLSFRTKLLGAMLLVVVGVSGATLWITQRRVQDAYIKLFHNQAAQLADAIGRVQVQRADTIKQISKSLSSSVRLRAILQRVNNATEQNDTEDLPAARERLYQVVADQLGANQFMGRPDFFRLLDASGRVLAAPPTVETGMTNAAEAAQLDRSFTAAGRFAGGLPEQPTVGLLPIEPKEGSPRLMEVVVTPVKDADTAELLGVLAMGFSMAFPAPGNEFLGAFWVDDPGTLYYSDKEPILSANAPAIKEYLRSSKPGGIGTNDDFTLALGEVQYEGFLKQFANVKGFPAAHTLFLHDMAGAQQQELELQERILLFSLCALAGALLLSYFLADGLYGPIHDLMGGIRRVREGDFTARLTPRSRDEIGRLAESFNEMTHGLAEREKFRSVLNMVADKAVAEELMRGEIVLGGEAREVSVLFCDIRGFTALTQNMDPREVIQMINEHFTPLTKMVYEHNGVVDKFVGDLIMAVFGAPKSHGNDAANAVRCALRMLEERQQQNKTAKHKIEVGIGIATGSAVAGCVGSADRLNYTVLGERVNLASRLCGQAGRMEVVIDQTTRDRLGRALTVQELPPLALKGFTGAIQAYKLIEYKAQP